MKVLISTAVLLFVTGFIILAMNKAKQKQGKHYDEMQMQIRGRGNAAGFWTALAGLAVAAILFEKGVIDFISPSLVCMGILSVSIAVFIVYCIARDAYFFVNEKLNSHIVCGVIMVAVNCWVFIINLTHGGLMEDGMLSYRSCYPLIIGCPHLAGLIALLVKKFGPKKEADE